MPTSDCDVFCQDCPPGEAEMRCQAVDLFTRSVRICEAHFNPDELPGEGVAGDPCEYSTDCKPGYHCLFPEGWLVEGECRPFCDLAAVNTGADAGVDADVDGLCEFSRCGEDEGTCQVPRESDGSVHWPMVFGEEHGVGLCLEE